MAMFNKILVVGLFGCIVILGQGLFAQTSFAGAQIEWLSNQVTTLPDSDCLKALPNGPAGSNMRFGKEPQKDDLVLIGKVVSTEPVFLGAWYNKVKVQTLEVVLGAVDKETVEFLAIGNFTPTSRGINNYIDSSHGTGWVIKDDIVLLALRTVPENSFINEYYFLYSVRYFRDMPVTPESTAFAQYGSIDFDWQSYEEAFKNDKAADPYRFLTLRRAPGICLKDEIDLLLGKEISE